MGGRSPKEIWMEAHDEILDELGLSSINEVQSEARDDVDALIENRFQEKISDYDEY